MLIVRRAVQNSMPTSSPSRPLPPASHEPSPSLPRVTTPLSYSPRSFLDPTTDPSLTQPEVADVRTETHGRSAASPLEPRSPTSVTVSPVPPVADLVVDRSCRGWSRRLPSWEVLLILGALPLLMLLGAVLVQVLGHEEPCPLCVLQRYACLITTGLLWTAALVRPARRALGLLGAFVALGGAGIAGHHTMVVWNPIVSCGIDTLQPLINGWAPAHVAPLLFEAMGMCTNPAPLMGLPLPIWSMFGFLVTSIGIASWWWHTRVRSGARAQACPRCG